MGTASAEILAPHDTITTNSEIASKIHFSRGAYRTPKPQLLWDSLVSPRPIQNIFRRLWGVLLLLGSNFYTLQFQVGESLRCRTQHSVHMSKLCQVGSLLFLIGIKGYFSVKCEWSHDWQIMVLCVNLAICLLFSCTNVQQSTMA